MENNTDFNFGNVELVAWTSNGKLKMIPSLREEVEQDFIDAIMWYYDGTVNDEKLFRLSMAYDRYGDFLYETGEKIRAQRAYQNGAICLLATEHCQICDSPYGSHWVIPRKLSQQFFYLYDKSLKKEYCKESLLFEKMHDCYMRLTGCLT